MKQKKYILLKYCCDNYPGVNQLIAILSCIASVTITKSSRAIN